MDIIDTIDIIDLDTTLMDTTLMDTILMDIALLDLVTALLADLIIIHSLMDMVEEAATLIVSSDLHLLITAMEAGMETAIAT